MAGKRRFMQTTLYIPRSTQLALRDLAERTGQTQADLIRAALRSFVSRHPATDGEAVVKRFAQQVESWLESQSDNEK